MSNLDESMPKLKTRKSAARRFRVTGTGKLVRRKAYKSHLLQHKKTARKRRLSQTADVHETNAENVRLMMPYL